MSATHAYVARRKCGCVISLIADEGSKSTAKEVAANIRFGCTIDRVDIGKVRSGEISLDFRCKHGTATRKGES